MTSGVALCRHAFSRLLSSDFLVTLKIFTKSINYNLQLMLNLLLICCYCVSINLFAAG